MITDGHLQEFSQVDYAIESVIPNAKRVQCWWHIVHKGFEKYIDTTFPDISTSIVNEHKKMIQSWIYIRHYGEYSNSFGRNLFWFETFIYLHSSWVVYGQFNGHFELTFR